MLMKFAFRYTSFCVQEIRVKNKEKRETNIMVKIVLTIHSGNKILTTKIMSLRVLVCVFWLLVFLACICIMYVFGYLYILCWLATHSFLLMYKTTAITSRIITTAAATDAPTIMTVESVSSSSMNSNKGSGGLFIYYFFVMLTV